jgi:hypothetical protein
LYQVTVSPHVQLRKNYEHALQERNDAGLHLIERNEEVCVFHERLNMQEAVLREAALELMAREEEIRYLRMEVTQLQTHIMISRRDLPQQSWLQAELDSAQIQVHLLLFLPMSLCCHGYSFVHVRRNCVTWSPEW